jgi:hypothetical protein
MIPGTTHEEGTMSHINHIEDENRYRNDLGRENRSAIKRSLLMALMAVGAITAAVLLAPASDPSPIRPDARDARMSIDAPALAPEPTDPVVGSYSMRRDAPPDDRIEVGYY